MQCMYELYSWAYATLRYVTLFRKETIIYISFIKWASCVLGHINTHVSPVEQENLTTLHLSPKWASRDRKVSLSRRLTFSLSRQRSIRSDRDGGSKASSFTEADGVTSYHPLRLVFQISDFSSIPSATPVERLGNLHSPPSMEDAYARSVSEVLDFFGVDSTKGLSDSQVLKPELRSLLFLEVETFDLLKLILGFLYFVG